MSGSPALQQLNETIDQYRRRYWSLPPRDRMLVNIIAATLTLMLLWLVVIAPAQRMRSEAAVKLAGQQATLQWVKDNEARAQAIVGKTASSPRKSGQSLMAAVTSSSAQMGLTLKRYEPEGQEKLRVWAANRNDRAIGEGERFLHLRSLAKLLHTDRRARGRTKLYVRAWALSFQDAAIVQ